MTIGQAKKIVFKRYPDATVDFSKNGNVYAIYAKAHPLSAFSMAVSSYVSTEELAWLSAANKINAKVRMAKEAIKEARGY